MNKLRTSLYPKGILMKCHRYFILLYLSFTLLVGQKTFIHAGKLIDGKNDIPIEMLFRQSIAAILNLERKII